jgi:alkanesulfonate monooxygenase SsuD/methylene tetrahydromethanopterin reductase-like flavin-dependent oxidoreductase (luciferase family)
MFDDQANGEGPILAGDPNEVADRLAAIHAALRHDRHILQFDIGNIDHAAVMRSIELLGTKVLPQVQAL